MLNTLIRSWTHLQKKWRKLRRVHTSMATMTKKMNNWMKLFMASLPCPSEKPIKKHESAILSGYLRATESRLTIAMCLHMLEYQEQGSGLGGSEKKIKKINVPRDHNSSRRTSSPLGFALAASPPPILFSNNDQKNQLEWVSFTLMAWAFCCLHIQRFMFMADCLVNMFWSFEWV